MFIEFKEKPLDATPGPPLINEPLIPRTAGSFGARQLDVRLLVDWVRKTPEALGILRAIATDVVTKISFRSVSEQKMGRKTEKFHEDIEKKAESFAMDNQLKKQQIAAVIDWIMTGDFYIWIDRLPKGIVGDLSNKFNVPQAQIRKFVDEDRRPRKIQYVPSETVTIDYDETKITGFIQETFSQFPTRPTQTRIPAGIKRRYWKPDQIIHGKFMDMSGKIYGHTPMIANAPVIRMLGLIKDYAGGFFESGGPDWLMMFETSGATNKKNLKTLKEEMKKYKKAVNAHGFLIGETSGGFKAWKLNDFNKDMEFRQLSVMLAGTIAFSLGFPASRLKSIIGTDVKSSTGETDADTDAYERNIENLQDDILTLWNTQLWIPFFGVKQELSKGYRQDEVRETQAMNQKATTISALTDAGVEMDDRWVMEYLGVDREDITKIDLKAKPAGNPLPNKKVLKGPASQAHQEEKKNQAVDDKNKQMGS